MALATVFPWDEISAFTSENYVPRAIDQIFKSRVLFSRLLKAGNITSSGGSEIRIPLEFDKTNGAAYDGGTDVVSMEKKKTHDYAVLDW